MTMVGSDWLRGGCVDCFPTVNTESGRTSQFVVQGEVHVAKAFSIGFVSLATLQSGTITTRLTSELLGASFAPSIRRSIPDATSGVLTNLKCVSLGLFVRPT